MKKWQLQEAKEKLDTIIQEAINNGPQTINVKDKATAIVLSVDQYAIPTSPKSSFINFLEQSPLVGLELELKRDDTSYREIEL